MRIVSGAIVTAIVGVSLSGSGQAQTVGNLTVEVDGLRNQSGELCLKLFSGSRGFPNSNESALKRQCVKIAANPLTLTFSNLKPGSYAVAVFHDTNGDRSLNRNGLGMPSEGFGFSQNPLVRQGPPSFGTAAFFLAGPETRLKIQMRYSVGN